MTALKGLAKSAGPFSSLENRRSLGRGFFPKSWRARKFRPGLKEKGLKKETPNKTINKRSENSAGLQLSFGVKPNDCT